MSYLGWFSFLGYQPNAGHIQLEKAGGRRQEAGGGRRRKIEGLSFGRVDGRYYPPHLSLKNNY
jgi:hypothetical protein